MDQQKVCLSERDRNNFAISPASTLPDQVWEHCAGCPLVSWRIQQRRKAGQAPPPIESGNRVRRPMLVQAGRKLHSWCYTYRRKRQSQKTQRADEGRRTGRSQKIRRRVNWTVTRIHGARFGLQEPPLRKPHSGPTTEVQKELTQWCSNKCSGKRVLARRGGRRGRRVDVLQTISVSVH